MCHNFIPVSGLNKGAACGAPTECHISSISLGSEGDQYSFCGGPAKVNGPTLFISTSTTDGPG